MLSNAITASSANLSNIFLHYVLDEWFETQVRPRLAGNCTLVRFADGWTAFGRGQNPAVGRNSSVGARRPRY